MRGVIVPPSKLIVTTKITQKAVFFYQGGFIIKGGRLSTAALVIVDVELRAHQEVR